MAEDKTITVSKKYLDSLTARVESLESGKTFKKPQRVKEHIAYLRLHDGKPVVEIGNAVDVYDKAKLRWRLDLPIKVEGADDFEMVDYMGFLEANNQVKVSILKQTPVERIESGGIAPKHSISTDKLTGEEIDLTVTYIDYQVQVEITEGELKGKILTVPATALNA